MRSVFTMLLLLIGANLFAQNIPSPKEHFGFNIGDNYRLATYTQTEAYFKKIAAASNRVKLVDIGKTEEGRTQYMVIVSSPENLKQLEKYKSISQRLARAENLSNEQAKELAAQGKAVVWIDGGLHATETVGAHQLIETIWQFISRNDAETQRILNDAIILFVHANPDGQELVSNWYMRHTDTLKRSLNNLPRLYQKYIGHDNNRDFFMNNMSETRNMSRQQYIEWMPQILYNHHQTGPAGSVVAGPPYRDPFNFAFDPLLVTGIDAVGAAMINRLNVEDKPGYTQRGGSVFSTWWNGGLRTTAYFHNIIGLLTEIIGNPTPSNVPLVTARLIPNAATPYPVTPQRWLFRQSIDYSVSLNYAVLDYAVRNREPLLYNIYKMGKNSIDKGNKDQWSLSPNKVEAIKKAFFKDQRPSAQNSNQNFVDTVPLKYYDAVFKDPAMRDPRGFIIPSDQPDMSSAVKFVNTLLLSGIRVEKATADFSVAGKTYPAGSYVVKANQAFRPHVIDMFEPQDHPNDFLYPGGPPVRPYDAAGWTPAFTMGFKFDRILTGFDGPFETIAYGAEQKTPGKFSNSTGGYLLSAAGNASFIAVNDLLKEAVEVIRITDAAAQGSFFVKATSKSKAILEKAAKEYGTQVVAVSKQPAGTAKKIKSLRIGLWDVYGGSMASGWMRWIFEQHHFPYTVIYAKDIDAGKLIDQYDVIVFVSEAIPSVTTGGGGRGFGGRGPRVDEVPAEYQKTIGRITADSSIPQLKQFVEAGGSIVTIGHSANLAYHFKLPVKSALVEMNNGVERVLPGEKYYIPGSVLRVKVDSTQQPAWGMNSEADVFVSSSPVFKLSPAAIAKGEVTPIAWYATAQPLRSGWAWGQEYLLDGIAAFSAKMGKGNLYVFGPEITFRSQTHGTFKFLFNQLTGSK
ncbi:MAG: peptidase [Chitinophagaceae bacterium]|nr:peptidase [Chitinophagaceae bacterium]